MRKLDDLLLNLVVVIEARRIKGVTLLRAADATKQLVIRVRRGEISAFMHDHIDSISPSLAAEGAMRK